MSESTIYESTVIEADEPESPPLSGAETAAATTTPSFAHLDHEHFASNIDLRYGGQYLTPDQLPQFCDQLHNLVQVIRNIQSYAKVTGEYPKNLERRLQQEAEEVAALAAEARNAREVVTRTRLQRRAVYSQRKQLVSQLTALRETEQRELENTVRLSDRRLYKNWESVKESSEPSDLQPLFDDVKSKQAALECLLRLIENRKNWLNKTGAAPAIPQALPAPATPLVSKINEESTEASASNEHRRESRRMCAKRRRREAVAGREPRSTPMSVQPSQHGPQPQVPSSFRQVTLFIQNAEGQPRCRVNSEGAMTLTSLELPSMDNSARDIIFFTSTL